MRALQITKHIVCLEAMRNSVMLHQTADLKRATACSILHLRLYPS